MRRLKVLPHSEQTIRPENGYLFWYLLPLVTPFSLPLCPITAATASNVSLLTMAG